MLKALRILLGLAIASVMFGLLVLVFIGVTYGSKPGHIPSVPQTTTYAPMPTYGPLAPLPIPVTLDPVR
jgi:hypothetical protein